MDGKNIEVNSIWRKYEEARDYIYKKGLVSRTDKFWNFYLGDQWIGLKRGGEELPTMNIIKPLVKFKVSTISQNALTANFSDADPERAEKYRDVYAELNRRFALSWEKAKMTDVAWKNNKAAAVQGDSYVYFGSSDTNEAPQVIGNTSILFADENETDIQAQAYIIIRERLDIKKVREMAKENGVSQEEIDMIGTDSETTDEIYNKDEVKDKVTSLLYLTKINGVVNFAKATKACIYVPLHPLDVKQNGQTIGGMTSYPLVSMIWEPKPNSARGLGEVEMLIPNQLEINKTLARRAVAVKLGAYPRIAYDASAVENPEDLDKVGKAIGVTTGNAQSVSQAISYLNATNISSDADALFRDLLQLTRELSGAGDNSLGNINPERASGQAIIAVRDQAQVPLNEQINAYRQWVERVALLWFDIWSTYEPDSFIVNEPVTVTNELSGLDTDSTRERTLSYEELMALKPTVHIDVSEDNRWTKLSEQQSADNLLDKQHITFEEWAELCADNGPIPKAKILKIVQERKMQQEAMAAQQLADQNMEFNQSLPEEMPEGEGEIPPLPVT